MTEKEFLENWKNKIESEFLKTFPEDFTDYSEVDTFELPGKTLIMGPELFGAYEVLDTEGNSVLTTQNLAKAKYILYANRNKPTKISIPKAESKLREAVKEYQNHLNNILKEIKKDFDKNYSGSKDFNTISNKIFNSLNLKIY
jgi:hypothetical protein